MLVRVQGSESAFTMERMQSPHLTLHRGMCSMISFVALNAWKSYDVLYVFQGIYEPPDGVQSPHCCIKVRRCTWSVHGGSHGADPAGQLPSQDSVQ